jgi:hypothetical protein
VPLNEEVAKKHGWEPVAGRPGYYIKTAESACQPLLDQVKENLVQDMSDVLSAKQKEFILGL